MKNIRFYLLAGVAALSLQAMAQGTAQDYRRAYDLRSRYSMNNVWNADVNPRWIDGSDKFYYATNTPEGRRYKVVDAARKKRTLLFDHTRLAKELSASTGTHISPDSLYLAIERVTPGLDTVDFAMRGTRYSYASKAGKLNVLPPLPPRPEEPHWMVVDPETDGEPVMSPDGKHKAFIRD
ncbi:MAG: S9 family peptidase, partial [Clostridiales bacterium]|nr:S9 family peptidase [Clostridiales bacterium]